MLAQYIKEHQGRFPQSQQELMDCGLLQRATDNEYVWIGPSRKDLPKFEEFEIAYGISHSDIEMKEGSLYSIRTGEEIFLIKGPESSRKYAVWPYYRWESRTLFKLMRELQANTEQ